MAAEERNTQQENLTDDLVQARIRRGAPVYWFYWVAVDRVVNGRRFLNDPVSATFKNRGEAVAELARLRSAHPDAFLCEAARFW